MSRINKNINIMAKSKTQKLTEIGIAGQKHHDKADEIRKKAATEKDAKKQAKLLMQAEIEMLKFYLKKKEFEFVDKFQ
jgi:hypothetical protein